MQKPTLLGSRIVYAILALFIITFSSCSQLFFTPEQLNDNGYYVQAERDLAKANSSADQSELLIALHGQHKYKEANELLSTMNQVDLISNDRTKNVVLDLNRIAGNYKTSELTASLESSEIEQFYTWPSKNATQGNLELTKTPLMYKNESFTGLHIDRENDKLYMGKQSSKEVLGVSHYSIEEVNFKNNLLVNTWKSSVEGAEKDRVYSTSPSVDSKDQMYFSMSLFEGVSMNPAKMVAWNKETMVNYLGIFSTTVGNTKTVTPLPEKINQLGCNNTHPHILNDTILFFSSDRVKKGDMDIYYSILKFGNWSEPQALSMNSTYDDVMPVSDGKNLYFSSRGNKNFGGLDVFKCKLNFANGKITTGPVENMMQPFNSSSDDMMAFMLSENTGYMATNRNSDGGDEIYYFKLDDADRINSKMVNPDGGATEGTVVVSMKDENGNWVEQETLSTNGIGVVEDLELKKNAEYKLVYSSPGLEDKTVLISALDPANPSKREQEIKGLETVSMDWEKSKGVVQDRISNQPMGGVDITATYTDENGDVATETFQNKNDGSWMFDIKPGTDYNLTFSKEGYEDFTTSAATFEELKALKVVQMTQESKKGDKIKIPNVYFDYNSAELQQESFAIMDNIVAFMNDRPTMKVELGAHSDSKGSDSYNQKLSEKRAKTCYDYLVSKNIDASRLKFKGYGETQLQNRCKNGVDCTDEEHALNRRMELKVISE